MKDSSHKTLDSLFTSTARTVLASNVMSSLKILSTKGFVIEFLDAEYSRLLLPNGLPYMSLGLFYESLIGIHTMDQLVLIIFKVNRHQIKCLQPAAVNHLPGLEVVIFVYSLQVFYNWNRAKISFQHSTLAGGSVLFHSRWICFVPTPGGSGLCLIQVDLFCASCRLICFVPTR